MDKNAFLIDLSEGPRSQFGRVPFAQQSEPQRVFSCLWSIESEVNNGGFRQYFENESGETAEFAPWALRTIGAVKMAAIAQEALGVFLPAIPPQDTEARRAQLGHLSPDAAATLERLDEEFMAYPEDLTDLLYEFVRSHPGVFGPTPG